MRGSCESRRREFSSGRWCARRLLRSRGLPDFPVLPGPAREPLWPAELVGTISHSAKWSICAIASSNNIAGLGADVESLEGANTLPEEILFTCHERNWLANHRIGDRHRMQVVLFSAKESLYKALFPLYGEYIDYLDAEIGIDTQTGSFQVTCSAIPLSKLLSEFYIRGRYLCCDNHVWSGVTLINRYRSQKSPHGLG